MKVKISYIVTILCVFSFFLFVGCERSEAEIETTEEFSLNQTEESDISTDDEKYDVATENSSAPEDESMSDEVSEETEKMTDAFFEDAIFIGDSVSMALRSRSLSENKLPGATFVVRASYGSGHAVNGTMLLSYRGTEMSPENAVSTSGAKKVFIMLGMNDLNIYGLDGTIANWNTLTNRIKEKSPDVQIYVQSMSPIVTGSESGKLNNPTIDEYNQMLHDFASQNGFCYIDVATFLKDETNGLSRKYCSDNYVHLNNSGADVWIDVLEKIAEEQK